MTLIQAYKNKNINYIIRYIFIFIVRLEDYKKYFVYNCIHKIKII